ncbi:oxysterol-binding protein 1 [Drosophila grimshawi]|uniref:Oxysterol-binding protein n=1 Tax=Drosophila grimshawi TaxID=7222 RepID=B4JRV6_DROGR|nr:oxysterol-binding protein 1 [Drosophila grimshawi]EDV94496.1 GH21537 [Drosophila grimshawi]
MSVDASARTTARQRLESQSSSNNENNNNNSSSSNNNNNSNKNVNSSSNNNSTRSSQKMRKRGRGGKHHGQNHATVESDMMMGWLQKWTNYVKGYQRRWFVLSSNGVLSYYLDQSEVDNHQSSRGAISVKSAHIEHVDSCTFIISIHGSKQNFRIRAETEAEQQKWITSLERAKGEVTQSVVKAAPAVEAKQQVVATRSRRTRVPDKANYPLNLWSLMKNCIGKDLSKIPMPVNFNEPISMLQRLVEDYEYSEILDTAAACTDECEQLAHLAAFTVSAYATAASRINKPFNPLLGETYECDRTDDLGWRCVAEQVSHHPPIAAVHCEGRDWITWQEFSMTSKFRGSYLQVNPIGGAYLAYPSSGRRYSWRRVTTTVNNIIIGKLWVDLEGQMEIVGSNAAQGYRCVLNYIPYSYFGREVQRSVKGVVYNRNNEAKWVVRGTWDDKVEIAPVLQTSGTPKSPSYTTGNYKVAWQRRPEAPDAAKYYNFPQFACQLNEPEERVAPTDSRLRPDQRLMEDGDWDRSNEEKLRLEEKQRAVRKQREIKEKHAAAKGQSYPDYEPRWFKRQQIDGSKEFMHVSTGRYWKAKADQDWSGCPNIY